jgi:hypothetical protein
MKNVLLTGQLIWEALQAESGDFDVLWEALQSQKIQGYITQNDLDTLYRQIAQEQDVSIAFSLVTQLQRVLLIHAPNRSQLIDIEVNNSVYSHSVAVDQNETSVLSLHGFLERYALNMLYANDSLTDGSDGESSLGMQKWYRKWRHSGFDMLWLIPVMLTLALQSMPFFQKVVADLFDSLGGGQDSQSPDVAQRNRRSESNSEPSRGERSPFIPFPRLPGKPPSSAESPAPSSAESPNLTGDIRYPLRNPAPSALSQSDHPQQSTELVAPQLSPIRPPTRNATAPTLEVQPAAPSTNPPSPQKLPAPDENEPYNTKPNDTPPDSQPPNNSIDDSTDNLLVPIPVFIFPIIPKNGDSEKPLDTPTDPSTEPLPIDDSIPTLVPPPPDDIQLDVAGDGVMNIPDPLIDPSQTADPYLPNLPQSQPKPELPPDTQSSLPDNLNNDSLEIGALSYEQDYQLTIAPESPPQAIGGIGVISVDPYGIEPDSSGIGINSGAALNQFLPGRY